MSKAIVTGATSGIGRAITLALAGAGHEVLAIGRDARVLSDLASTVGVTPLSLDLSDLAAVRAALTGREADVLVNNAGLMPPLGPFCDQDEGDMARALHLNVSSALAVTRAIAPGMRARGHGHVFFTGSTAGHAAFANLAVYGATKAALGSFAQSLRLELAEAGVRVTEIVAGRVETGLYRDLLSPEARAEMYAGRSAVQPEDVAAMVNAVLALPPNVDVARFDILPTRAATATGIKKG